MREIRTYTSSKEYGERRSGFAVLELPDIVAFLDNEFKDKDYILSPRCSKNELMIFYKGSTRNVAVLSINPDNYKELIIEPYFSYEYRLKYKKYQDRHPLKIDITSRNSLAHFMVLNEIYRLKEIFIDSDKRIEKNENGYIGIKRNSRKTRSLWYTA